MRKQGKVSIADLGNLPDFAVLNDEQTAAVYGISTDTLNRRRARGEGPQRIQISQRRFGTTVGSVKEGIARLAQAADAAEVD